MPLQKQNLNINFANGLDTKTDPFQLSPGKFLSLQNVIFTKGGLLQKRNGFQLLPSLSDATNTYLTTFNGNLTAMGTSINAFSLGSQSWINKGSIQSTQLNVLPLIRNSNSQTQCDAAVSGSFVCTAYTDAQTSGTIYRYAVADVTTGQNIIAPTTFTATGSPRVFVLGNYFVVVFPNNTHLQYIAIPVLKPTSPTSVTDISTQLTYATTNNFDGVVLNGNLYLVWNGSDGGGAIRYSFIDQTLVQHATVVLAGKVAAVVGVWADQMNNIVWVGFYQSSDTTTYVFAMNLAMTRYFGPTLLSTGPVVTNITGTAINSTAKMYAEVTGSYSFDSSIPTNKITEFLITDLTGTNSSENLMRGVGLASKGFLVGSTSYVLVAYQSNYQPSYFLIDSTANIIGKIAYSNGGGYYAKGLPSFTQSGSNFYISYLFKDIITPVNKNTNVLSGTQVNGIYAQTGINLVTFTIGTGIYNTAELGNNLMVTGGILYAYDGYNLVEQNFHLYPDLDLNADGTYHGLSTATSGGHIADSTKFFYVATYEWSDNQGNLFRSAPSVPVSITTGNSGSNVNTNTIKIPTLRVTVKTSNLVKIVVYRWSTNQQTYYQVTSVSAPTMNDTTVDSVTITDTFSDATILGNSILYTTGGVVEDIGPPATSALAIFKSRLFLVDAEDKNLLWFSKQVIEGTPVEMSDLFTIFVAPTIGAQGSTGPITALAAMDDKLILFKKNAIYYLTGNGPDNLGNNNDFSEPVFITSTVGCTNQNSIVFMPQGLMFQSDKGIWLLGRDLSTTYIGAPVEAYNSTTVLSALTIPGTNQVRFTLNNGLTLMYDYFYGQWGTFNGISGIASTLYQNLHSFINSTGAAYQELSGSYLDGSNPVLIQFTTGWMNLSGLQGYERAYSFYLLAGYISPHKLTIGVAYDYASAPSQSLVIMPDNFTPAYGGDPLWGSTSPYGGPGSLEQWRIHFTQQKCQAFQISIQESYDPSFGVSAGAGFTLSGIDLVVGSKSGYPRLSVSRQAG